ncbi:MAG TPA: hypothetical protein VGR08_14110 [Thermomicrobiales bacterium]|nr:hypothetical protein [Thermomicrobiales bacterium]
MTDAATSPPSGIPGLDPADVLSAARRQLGISDGILRSCRWRSLWAPRLASTSGVYRIDWLIESERGTREGALVLKVLACPGPNVAPGGATLYASGALDNLPSGLRAARWFGNVDLGPDHLGVWLDPEQDDPDVAWDVERFGIAARHLGRLAGTHEQALREQAGQRPARTFWGNPAYVHDTLRTFAGEAAHDLARRAWPEPSKRALLRLWTGSGAMVERAQSLPVMPCHGDAQRRNLFARRDASGVTSGEASSHVTVAVDWANFGMAPAGMDIATLAHYAIAYFDVAADDIIRLEVAVLDSYLDGLRDQGVDIDRATVRFGYAAQLVFGLGLLETGPVLRLATTSALHRSAEAFYGQPIEAILDRRRVLAGYLLDVALRMERMELDRP